MADYQITLSFGSAVIHIPVMPEKLTVKSPGKNETATVLELGEINRIKQRGLRQVSWESHFPANNAPYVTGWEDAAPVDYVQGIEDARDSRESGRFSITGTDLNINMAVAVEDFSYEERGGEVGDIYYSITLKEWKDYSAMTVSLPSPKKAVNMAVAVEDFSYEERGGEVGDIYYSITLKEWKDYSAMTVSLPSPKKAAATAPSTRASTPKTKRLLTPGTRAQEIPYTPFTPAKN